MNIFRLVGINHCRPCRATADGNCLYNSMSLAYFGTETHSYELRVRTAIKLKQMAYELCSTEFMSKVYGQTVSEKDMELIISASVNADDLDYSDHAISIANMSKRVLKSGIYSSVLEVVAVGHVLNRNINIIYPCNNNPFTKKELFSGELKCCTSTSETADPIIISWTHTSNRDNQSGKWIPNHFVPCEVSDVTRVKIVEFYLCQGHKRLWKFCEVYYQIK